MRQRRCFWIGLVALCALPTGCSRTDKAPKQRTEIPGQSPGAGEIQPVHEKAAGPITWRHDDYKGALAAARSKGLPLVVDMWAPWCHTCLAMKSDVLADASLADVADRFVWVALDTDKPVNAAVQDDLPVDVWPTFYVVSSHDDSIQAQHRGGASLKQFRDFLAQGEGGHLDALGKSGQLDAKLAAKRAGDRHGVFGRYKEADLEYAKALELGGPSWPRRPEVLVSRITTLYRGDNFKACLVLAKEHLSEIAAGLTASAVDFMYYGIQCADKLDPSAGKSFRELAAADDGPLLTVLNEKDSQLSVDDRSEAMRMLREIHDKLGDQETAFSWAQRQRKLLDDATSKAENAFIKMTYNWPRAEVYSFLGEAEALVPDLKESVEALPDQYDPPYRLGWIYLQTGDYDSALEMANRALAKVYGPRKGRVYILIAEIHKARGDRAGELKARRDVVATYEALPSGQAKPKALAKAKQELASLEGS